MNLFEFLDSLFFWCEEFPVYRQSVPEIPYIYLSCRSVCARLCTTHTAHRDLHCNFGIHTLTSRPHCTPKPNYSRYIDPEYEGNIFLRNVRNTAEYHTVSHSLMTHKAYTGQNAQILLRRTLTSKRRQFHVGRANYIRLTPIPPPQ